MKFTGNADLSHDCEIPFCSEYLDYIFELIEGGGLRFDLYKVL